MVARAKAERGEFVVAGGDAAEVLQAAERSFDAPAFAIALHIARLRFRPSGMIGLVPAAFRRLRRRSAS